MKILKYMEIRLNVTDVTDMFCSNYDTMVLNLLKKKLVGRCYKSVYIVDIKQIVKRGELTCCSKSLEGNLYVDAQFEAECIVYEKGEFIHNCKVIRINEKNIILASSDYAAVRIKNSSDYNIFKEGDDIPVIVHTTRYNLFDLKIAVSAIPFIPIRKEIIYYQIQDNVFSDDKNDIARIRNLENKIKTFNSNSIKFFTELIYPYKKQKKYNSFGKLLNLDKFNTLNTGDIIFTGDRRLNEDSFYLATNINSDEPVLSISKQNAYYTILYEYEKDLHNLLGFLENYNIEKIKHNSIIWKMFTSLKS